MRLILVRHGETRLNKEGRAQSRSPEGLTGRGRLQARAVAQALEGEGVEALYSSPLRRALETAHLIAEALGLPVHTLRGLRELDLGEVEGLPFPEVRRLYPDLVRQWREDASRVVFPGGESLPQVQRRAWRAVHAILRRHPRGTVAVITHNFTIQALLCTALSLPLSAGQQFHTDLGSLTILRLEPEEDGARVRAVLEVFNERCHLKGLPPTPSDG